MFPMDREMALHAMLQRKHRVYFSETGFSDIWVLQRRQCSLSKHLGSKSHFRLPSVPTFSSVSLRQNDLVWIYISEFILVVGNLFQSPCSKHPEITANTRACK